MRERRKPPTARADGLLSGIEKNATKKNFYDNKEKTLRVATKFSNITKNYYSSIGRDIDIIHLNGSIEIAPILDLSDVIVDIVETGSTLRENGLEVLEEIFQMIMSYPF